MNASLAERRRATRRWSRRCGTVAVACGSIALSAVFGAAHADDAQSPLDMLPPAPSESQTAVGAPPGGFGQSYGQPALAGMGKSELPYEKGEAVPVGYHVEPRYDKTMLVTGAAIFGGFYVPSALLATWSGNSADRWLFVPIVGPWIDVFTRAGCDKAHDVDYACANQTAYGVLLVIDGIAQAAGATIFSIAVATPRHVLARDPAVASAAGTVALRLTPALGRSGWGLTLSGAF